VYRGGAVYARHGVCSYNSGISKCIATGFEIREYGEKVEEKWSILVSPLGSCFWVVERGLTPAFTISHVTCGHHKSFIKHDKCTFQVLIFT
jgi:hypothetical protein